MRPFSTKSKRQPDEQELTGRRQARMHAWWVRAATRFESTRGVTSIEYALIGACIFVVIIASANQVGVSTGSLFDTVARMMSK